MSTRAEDFSEYFSKHMAEINTILHFRKIVNGISSEMLEESLVDSLENLQYHELEVSFYMQLLEQFIDDEAYALAKIVQTHIGHNFKGKLTNIKGKLQFNGINTQH